MTAPQNAASAAAPQALPLPGKQFQRFILIFHVVFIVGLAAVLLNRWQQPGFAWTAKEALLCLLVLSQGALYLRFFAFLAKWPLSWRAWAGYFSLNFVLWFITWKLDRSFEWVILAYLGQMFGVLPPRASVPTGGAIFLIYIVSKLGFERLLHITGQEFVGYAGLLIGWTTLGLFLHNLARTSSERAQLIDQLTAAQKELEAARAHDAELAALRERERLARDLHDSLGHSLVTLTVQLEVAQRLAATDPARAAGLLDQMKELTRTGTEALRRSLTGLRAPGLGERRLSEALRALRDQTKARTGLELECRIDPAADQLPEPVTEALWRVAQEGVANVEKHAFARAATLTIQFNSMASLKPSAQTAPRREAVLELTDDGTGLPADAEQKPGHFGLRGLRERVEGVGGTFSAVCSAPRGTKLKARIPVLA